MTERFKWTFDRDEILRKEYRTSRVIDIARLVGCDHTTVSRRLKKLWLIREKFKPPGRGLPYTAAEDAAVIDGIRAGKGRTAIATELNRSRGSVGSRLEKLQLRSAEKIVPPPQPRIEPVEREDPDRAPLAPGHPVSWGVLTAGTLLAGWGYPRP